MASEPGPLPAVSTPDVEPGATGRALPEVTSQELMQLLTSMPTSEGRITNEAAAALEFLAHGRRNVLNRFVGRDRSGIPLHLRQWWTMHQASTGIRPFQSRMLECF